MAEVIEQQQAKPSVQPAKKTHTALWVFGILTTLAIVIIAVAGFYILQEFRSAQDTDNSQDEQKILGLNQSINGLQGQIANLQSQLATTNNDLNAKETRLSQQLDTAIKQQNEKLDTTYQQFEKSIQQLQRQLGKTRSDWLIADAEYLLSVANQRLHLTGDVNTTRAALQAADERLKESADPAMFKIREQITKELAALSAVTVPDVVGLYAKLQLLKDTAKELTVLLPYSGKDIMPQAQKSHSNEEVLSEQGHDLIKMLGKQLEGYVTIRHTEQPVNSIITPEQVVFIKEQLNIKLEMIKISLLEQNDVLFQTSIADTQQWLKQNFAESTPLSTMLGELDKIRQVKLRSQFPDVSASLKMLKDISKLRLELDKATPPEAVSMPPVTQ